MSIWYSFEFIGAVGCLICGMLSGYWAHAGGSAWYWSLKKAPLNPPDWIFGPVWTLLYLMMGTALGILVRDYPATKLALVFFCLQFFCNLIWSALFFRWHRPDLALYDIIALLIFLLLVCFMMRNSPIVLVLLVPYVIWTSFALLLNAYIVVKN